MAQQKINQAQTDFKAGADALSAATLGTGVSVTDGYLTKIGNMVYLTGYFAKTSYSSGDTVLTLPTGYRPPNGMWRAACHGGGGEPNRSCRSSEQRDCDSPKPISIYEWLYFLFGIPSGIALPKGGV